MTNDFQIYIESKFSSLPVPYFHPPTSKERRKRETKDRKNIPVLFQTTDHEGKLWDVTQARETKHGFDLLMGYRSGPEFNFSPSRVIATAELTAFWEKNKCCYEGLTYDLPAGRTTLKRVRQRLGCSFRKDISKFWMDRLEDLKSLKLRDFCAKHKVSYCMAKAARLKLVGRTAREIGWWNKPTIIEYLRSGVMVRQISEKLGISRTQASRLRIRAQLKAQPARKLEASGPLSRGKFWWRSPDVMEILLSKKSPAEIAGKLGINLLQVSRLRSIAQTYSKPTE